MKNREFINLVRKMRNAQEQYFADRTKSNLQTACKLEIEVDAKLREFANAEANRQYDKQLDLFAQAFDIALGNKQ